MVRFEVVARAVKEAETGTAARQNGVAEQEMKIEWHESLSVGVSYIDEQHKLLFGKFNALLGAWIDGKGSKELVQLFHFLDAYLTAHLADEEELMHRFAYPGYQKHREVHQGFARKVAALKETLRREGPSPELVTTVSMTMTEWLVKHVSAADRAFGKFMKDHAQHAEILDEHQLRRAPDQQQVVHPAP